MKIAFLILASVALAAPCAMGGVTKGTYLGTSKTTVKYLNPNTLQVVSTQAYTCNETAVVGPLKKIGGQIETNPFSLTILATNPKTPPVNGDVKVGSARIFPVSGGGSVVVQYWLLQNTTTGFSGVLFDNHLVDGLARDRVIAKLGNSSGGYKMHDGQIGSGLQSSLVATVTGRQMALTITGYAFVPNLAIIQFTTKINARR